jgi:hypothetical protein
MSELHDILSDGPSPLAGKTFLAKLKTAGKADVFRAWYRAATSNPSALVGAGLGAALGGMAAYKVSKPGKDGLSPEQKLSRHALDAVEKREKERTSPASLPEELGTVGVRTNKEMADVFSRHPRSAAISGAVLAAPIGYTVLPRLLKLIKR